MKTLAARIATVVLCGGAAAASAAPIRPIGPVDLCGTIVSQRWEADRFVAGRPGASGSLGRDRTVAAHFRVVLENFRGIDGATARRINVTLGYGVADTGPHPARVMIWLPHADSRLLDGAVSLCVTGHRITGDEGGTSAEYRTISAKRGAPR